VSLAVVVGTWNRIDLLRRCVAAVLGLTREPAKLYITDAGSTDGTVEFLRELALREPRVEAVLEGRRVGQAKALNAVFRRVREDFVCWISDDNITVEPGLDAGVAILRADPSIGMVALKVRDVIGAGARHAYIGGISPLGILNVNQGMLPTKLLQQLGGFCEEHRDYGIDPDLTARVLLANRKVVYTRDVVLEHHREWASPSADPAEAARREQRRVVAEAAYVKTFAARLPRAGLHAADLKRFAFRLAEAALRPLGFDETRGRLLGGGFRDWYNACHSRYISVFDGFHCRNRPYHLVQSLRST